MMSVNTWAKLTHLAAQLLRGEQVREIRGIGDTLVVAYWDGRTGCLYLNDEGTPVLLSPAKSGPCRTPSNLNGRR